MRPQRNPIEWRANLPADLMAIADDAGGSVVCIGVRGKRRGRVYFWSLEDAPQPADPTSYEGIWEIAPSFDAFLASFHEAQP